MRCPLFPVNAICQAVLAVRTVSSLVRMIMGILTGMQTSYQIHRYHAPEMKNLQRKRIQIVSSCMGVAYAVNHFQRKKKQCFASTVIELTSFKMTVVSIIIIIVIHGSVQLLLTIDVETVFSLIFVTSTFLVLFWVFSEHFIPFFLYYCLLFYLFYQIMVAICLCLFYGSVKSF